MISRTSALVVDVEAALRTAGHAVTWRSQVEHRYGFQLLAGDRTTARQFCDNSPDCATCGPRRRNDKADDALTHLPQCPLWLSVIRPQASARHAYAKQIREHGGSAWVVPVLGGYAALSTVPVRDITRQVRSLGVPTYARNHWIDRMLELWWPETGRVGWIGKNQLAQPSSSPATEPMATPLSADAHPDSDTIRTSPAGRTSAALRRNLTAQGVVIIGPEERFAIDSYWDDDSFQRALRRSNYRPPNKDWEPPEHLLSPETAPPEEAEERRSAT